MSSSSVPEDILAEILLRLPVESLLRSKYVCKSWLNLISDPSFVKSHLNRTVHRNNPSVMLNGYEKGTIGYKYGNVLYSTKYDSLLSSETTEFDDISIQMDYPFKSRSSQVELVGSCTGLVFTWINHSFFCIWNPATKEYKKLPDAPYANYWMKGMKTYAFGYDCKTNDYKVVNMGGYVEKNASSLAQVYTLGSNSWKTISDVPYWFYYEIKGVHINGVLHWLGRHDFCSSPSLIISFDINSEKLSELQLPTEPLENKSWILALDVLEGCICVLVKDSGSSVAVWVMQDYGVPESWTKITIHWCMEIPSTLMESIKNDKILFFLRCAPLVLYDRKDGHTKDYSSVNLKSGVKYFKTLVSLNSGTYWGGITYG